MRSYLVKQPIVPQFWPAFTRQHTVDEGVADSKAIHVDEEVLGR